MKNGKEPYDRASEEDGQVVARPPAEGRQEADSPRKAGRRVAFPMTAEEDAYQEDRDEFVESQGRRPSVQEAAELRAISAARVRRDRRSRGEPAVELPAPTILDGVGLGWLGRALGWTRRRE